MTLLAALPACSPPMTVPPGTARPVAPPSTGVAALLRYAEELPASSAASLDEALAAISAVPPEEWSAADTIRFALLQIDGRPRPANPDDARRALERLVASPDEDGDMKVMARLLLEFFRAGAAAESGATSLVVAYPRRGDSVPMEMSLEIEALRSRLADERRRRLELERQLEALRALEAALDQRAANALDTDD